MNDEYLIKIDEPRIQETCDAYFKWKDLNTYVKSLVSRGINMPDAISEPMGCYCNNINCGVPPRKGEDKTCIKFVVFLQVLVELI